MNFFQVGERPQVNPIWDEDKAQDKCLITILNN
jgi:hypothetical protein